MRWVRPPVVLVAVVPGLGHPPWEDLEAWVDLALEEACPGLGEAWADLEEAWDDLDLEEASVDPDLVVAWADLVEAPVDLEVASAGPVEACWEAYPGPAVEACPAQEAWIVGAGLAVGASCPAGVGPSSQQGACRAGRPAVPVTAVELDWEGHQACLKHETGHWMIVGGCNLIICMELYTAENNW